MDEVTWRTSVEKEWNSSTYHSAVSELRTTIPVELNSLPHTPNPTPQDYTTGPYTSDKWGAWLKRLSPNQHRIQNMYRDKFNTNKESDTGVLVLNNGQALAAYNIVWQQSYQCSQGGKPRYKTNSKDSQRKVKPQNTPGSRLMACKATLNVRLLNLGSGNEMLHI